MRGARGKAAGVNAWAGRWAAARRRPGLVAGEEGPVPAA